MSDLVFANLVSGSDLRFSPLNAAFVGPTITAQPSAQSVTAPATATFTVTATSSGGALTYQWSVSTDGGVTFSPIAGATNSSYTTPSTTGANNNARYRVAVSDSNGTTTSTAVLLQVALPPAPAVNAINGNDILTSLQTGATFTGTNLGASVAERTVELVQGSVVVAQTQQPGNATSGSFNVIGFEHLGQLRYGTATFRLTTVGGTATRTVSLQPILGRKFITLTSVATIGSNRLTSTPDLAIGDQIELINVVGGTADDVTLNPDGTFSAAAAVTSFDFRVWSATSQTWGLPATQSLADPLAPPAGLTISAITSAGATASWSPVPGAVAYRIVVNDTAVTPDPSTTSIALTLSPATLYSVTVASIASDGAVSSASAPASFGTPAVADTTAPAWDGAVGLFLDALDFNTATAVANAATDNVGVVAYRWRLNGAPLTPDTASPTITIPGLTPETNYTLTVAARDGAGNESAQSPTLAFTTPAAPVVEPPPPPPPEAPPSRVVTSPLPPPSRFADLEELAMRAFTLYGDGAVTANIGDLQTHIITFANWVLDDINTHPYWTKPAVPYYAALNERREVPDSIIVTGLMAFYAGQQQDRSKSALYQPMYFGKLNQTLYNLAYGNAPISLNPVEH